MPEGGDVLKSMSVIPYIEDLHSGVPSDEEEYDQDHIFANNGTHIEQENTQCKYEQRPYAPPHKKTRFLHMRKQRRRSATQ